MEGEDSGKGHFSDLMAEDRERQRAKWSKALRFLVFITFGFAFLFLILSIFISLAPSWGSSLTQGVYPYFFVLLYSASSTYEVPLISVLIVMFVLYLMFFSTMTQQTFKHRNRSIIDTPIGYFVLVGASIFLVATIIGLLEQAFGTPIGGQGIDQQLQQNPLLGYMSLIYAPFVEELGFRILPLGILSFFIVLLSLLRNREVSSLTAIGYSFLAILAPGNVRKKYNLSLGAADWTVIVITSIIFGYAHIFFGAWDWGKFLPVFVTGLGLAIGFMKFGAYVDIPFHWLFNGFLSLYYLNGSFTNATVFLTLWILIMGIVGIVYIVTYVRNYRMKRGSGPTPSV